MSESITTEFSPKRADMDPEKFSRTEIRRTLPSFLEEQSDLLRNIGVSEVILFGSEAKGTATDQSDIDIAFIITDFSELKDRVTKIVSTLSEYYYNKISIRINNRRLSDLDRKPNEERAEIELLFIDYETFGKQIAQGHKISLWHVPNH